MQKIFNSNIVCRKTQDVVSFEFIAMNSSSSVYKKYLTVLNDQEQEHKENM